MDNEDELFKEGEFSQKLGPNIIEQFVKSHDLIGMIAELIQNDFDAKSRITKIHFQKDRLIITGYGMKIDKKGWERLSYWLGVGQESEKKGDIGRKNFGLRSLFLISNTIIISSGGYKTALDIERGARREKIKVTAIYQEDSSFKLEAEYRTESLGKLSVFTKEREKELFASLEKYLPSFIQFLVCSKKQKLCALKGGQILLKPYEIEIFSDRLDKSITGHVKMWEDKYVRELLNRTIDYKVIEDDKTKSDESRITEILLPIKHFSNMSLSEIPDYYLSKDKKNVITGISFAVDTKGKNPLVTHGGLFYPIGMKEQYTGLSFSINAPFLLDMDRDRIVHNDDWNEYLLTQTGKELGNIFSTKILPKYGANAYLLFVSNNIDNAYLKFYENALKSVKEYVINDLYDPKKNLEKRQFCGLNEQGELKAYLPSKLLNGKITPLLDLYPITVSLTGKERALSHQLAKSLMKFDENTIQNFLGNFKIKTFTIHNICELLVNDGKTKHTFSKDGGWHYPSKESFEKYFSNIDYIELHLDTLHKYWDLLTKEEIGAIKESDWLQDANSDPQCFEYLTLWEGDIKDFIWPVKDSIIHPKLAKHPIFQRRMFKLPTFNIIEKIKEKAEGWKELDDNERDVIFKFIVKNWRYILGEKHRKNQGLTKELKKLRELVSEYTVLKDSGGEWVKIHDLRVIDEKLKLIFGSSMHYPHPDIPKRLLSVLKAPTKLKLPEDIIKRCDTLKSATKEEIFSFEDYLSRRGFKEEVKKEIYEHLWSVSRLGEKEQIIKTSDAYIPSGRLERLLGTTVFPYLVIRNDHIKEFFQRIEVRENPTFEDMVEYLNYLKNNRGYLKDRKLFYIELAKSAERDSLKKEDISTHPIILIGQELFPPEKVIITRILYKYFKKGLRYWPESNIDPILRDSLKKLGCKEKVVKEHLIDYLKWIAEEYKINKQIGLEEKEGIHRAYSELKSYPSDEISNEAKIFLSRSNKLFSKNDIDNEILCFDDMSELAEKLIEQNKNIEFADYGEGRQFIDSSGIKTISSLIENVEVKLGKRVKQDRELTKKIASQYIKNALISANIQEFKGIMNQDIIKDLKKVEVYEEISKVYTVKSNEMEMSDKIGIKWDSEANCFVLCIVDDEIDNLSIAKEFSSFLIKKPYERYRAIDFLIILLSYENEQQIQDYLKFKNIDYVNYFKPSIEEYQDTEEEPFEEEIKEIEGVEDDKEEDGYENIEGEEKTPRELRKGGQRQRKVPTDDIGEKIEDEIDDLDEEEETIEELKRKRGTTKGEYVPTSIKKRPESVIHLQIQIKRKYDKCQICGLPVFEGIDQSKVYGHLRGHHLIPWQEKETVFNGLLCLCQPHHHMIHHAREVIFKIRKGNKTIEVFVNGKNLGAIQILPGHDILKYFLEGSEQIMQFSENVKIEILE
ncbi:MAG: hypothetical protein Q7J35_13625 [Candidatus Methanoperedens sp.]|nr:hypothetical protein [Candidatus Methanoperedens sp.]